MKRQFLLNLLFLVVMACFLDSVVGKKSQLMPWDQYIKVNQAKVHAFNERDNGDDLINFMGDGGTVTDGQSISVPDTYTPPNYMKKLNDAIHVIKKISEKKKGKYPTKKDCKKFRDLFVPKCDNEEERRLYNLNSGKRKHDKQTSAITVEESKDYVKKRVIKKRQLKSHKSKRRLMIGGVGGGGGQGAEASGSPQLSDARIVIHDFAAPEQPMPNLLEKQNSDRQPQMVRAIYRGPPSRILSGKEIFI